MGLSAPGKSLLTFAGGSRQLGALLSAGGLPPSPLHIPESLLGGWCIPPIAVLLSSPIWAA